MMIRRGKRGDEGEADEDKEESTRKYCFVLEMRSAAKPDDGGFLVAGAQWWRICGHNVPRWCAMLKSWRAKTKRWPLA